MAARRSSALTLFFAAAALWAFSLVLAPAFVGSAQL
eukprot:CAMPEP_0179202250 /NCGR_PEP_ID=MMETSP0796-20121207/100732_1 /TAXON_ID=73915 /ORGANISM="Pyrodinium bahamense, Strain pbaha01" /LENGTH=35 /DNA_ID= /DNA_START= /DNA_END= /DNA_ORIENTATION=